MFREARPHLSEEDRECVRKAIKSAVTKLTHYPILRIKEYAANGGSGKLEIVRDLFGLKPDDAAANRLSRKLVSHSALLGKTH